MVIIDFTEAKLEQLRNRFADNGDSYGAWAMSEILEMYSEGVVDIIWKDGFPEPVLRTDGHTDRRELEA